MTMAEKKTDAENAENMTFETAISRLEEIVHALESGNAPLDTSLGLFEEGVRLVKLCNARLDGARQKVVMLTDGGNGEMTETEMGEMK